jgi:hypothetical protein
MSAAQKSPRTVSDVRADLAKAWDANPYAMPAIEIEQAPKPCPPGFMCWRVVGTQQTTVLPALLPHAPVRIQAAHYADIVSNLVGVCPLCRRAATVTNWSLLNMTSEIQHVWNEKPLALDRVSTTSPHSSRSSAQPPRLLRLDRRPESGG